MEATDIEVLRSETRQTGILLDRYDAYEEPEEKSEDFAALHFHRIQRIPPLTATEERELLQREDGSGQDHPSASPHGPAYRPEGGS